MAHHLAELIHEADKGATRAERLRANRIAVETILKIWDRRASLPGNSYPLAAYSDVAKIVTALKPDANPFIRVITDSRRSLEQIAADLFDALSRLVILLLLMKGPIVRIRRKVNPSAFKALNPVEQYQLNALRQWVDLLQLPAKSQPRVHKSRNVNTLAAGRLKEASFKLIDRTTSILAELRKEIQAPRSTKESRAKR